MAVMVPDLDVASPDVRRNPSGPKIYMLNTGLPAGVSLPAGSRLGSLVFRLTGDSESTGDLTLLVRFTPTDLALAGGDPAGIGLYRHESDRGAWVPVSCYLDAASFSLNCRSPTGGLFAILVQGPGPTPVPTAASGAPLTTARRQPPLGLALLVAGLITLTGAGLLVILSRRARRPKPGPSSG